MKKLLSAAWSACVRSMVVAIDFPEISLVVLLLSATCWDGASGSGAVGPR